jgi:hypothetical protein
VDSELSLVSLVKLVSLRLLVVLRLDGLVVDVE